MNEKEKIEFFKSIGMKKRRTIEGVEREYLLTIFALLEPYTLSEQQRTFSEYYAHAGKEYELTWGYTDNDFDPLVQEITDYDFQQN